MRLSILTCSLVVVAPYVGTGLLHQEISQRIAEDHQTAIGAVRHQLQIRENEEVNARRTELDERKEVVSEAYKEWQKAKNNALCEADGSCGTGKENKRGAPSPAYDAKNDAAAELFKQYESQQNRLRTLEDVYARTPCSLKRWRRPRASSLDRRSGQCVASGCSTGRDAASR